MSDLISRQAAIDALNELRESTYEDNYGVFDSDDAINVIASLPPTEPKRGRWIKLDMHRGMADHKCTACEQECYVPTCMDKPMYAFCPNCGAKMEVTT